ncbi:UNKNOWN [Stylonychia lemnae]|uniref:Uncharacterized protein n=1 Tax=Stylonychia lemnae TaxID=5949 RepID=A0A077ZM93_STYLE|nr:UNKNOWN [Stylonychia lemnae]|eukprot:CDW71093.1 UNKNOWN [Stylonychia lemnae]
MEANRTFGKKFEEQQKTWTRQMQFKLSKFNIMQLSQNKAKLELQGFEKYSLMSEKEQKREDMVLEATQAAIVEANQMTNLKFEEQSKNKTKKKRKTLAKSTFFQYKSKSISIDTITQPLKLQEMRGTFYKQKKSSQIEHKETNNLRRNEISMIQNTSRLSLKIDEGEDSDDNQNEQLAEQNDIFSQNSDQAKDNMIQSSNQLKSKEMFVPRILAYKKFQQQMIKQRSNNDLIHIQDNYSKPQSRNNQSNLNIPKYNAQSFSTHQTPLLKTSFHLNANHLMSNRNLMISIQNNKKVNNFTSNLISPVFSQQKQQQSFGIASPIQQLKAQHQEQSLVNSSSQILVLPLIKHQPQKHSESVMAVDTTNYTIEGTITTVGGLGSGNMSNSDIKSRYMKGVLSLPKIKSLSNLNIQSKINDLVKNVNEFKEIEEFTLDKQLMLKNQ